MAALDDVLRLLGFSTPLIYGAATYGLFHWLDEKASDEGKAALSEALRIKDYDSKRLALALVEVFDKLYTHPLLRWRAFLRSVAFTLIVFVAFLYEYGVLSRVVYRASSRPIMASILAVNVMSDYCSLFVIRKWLILCGSRPFVALLGGSLIGGLIVMAGTFARGALGFVAAGWQLGALALLTTVGPQELARVFFTSLTIDYSIPAAVVFAWLPLFALGIFVLRLAKPTTAAVGKVQWFLKDGKQHPLEAVGYIAGIAVFLIVAGWQLFFRTGT